MSTCSTMIFKNAILFRLQQAKMQQLSASLLQTSILVWV